jgi:phage-related protein
MAVVGEAQIIVRAIGTSVKADIKNIFDGLDSVGGTSGKNLGEKFSQGFNKSGANNAVSKLADGLRKMNPEAERAREAWQKLTKTGFVLGPTITGLIGTISALIGSLVSIVGAAGAAGASLVVLGNIFAGFGLAMLSAKIALGGVMQALGAMGKGGGGAAKATDAIRRAQERLALVIEQNNEAIINANNQITDAQLNLNDALAAGREELQQLGFAAEGAALAEQGAALDLERAREELARVQDLPPNSRIRREAELAFAQAELQYRQALDANADLAAEQERYAESGVEGTQDVINARRELAEAEADLARTVRDGLRSQLEAERALAEARKSATEGGGADPFEGLTKSQKEFVKEMYKLKPLFEAVQEQVAKAFLPLLGGAVTTFANEVLPSIGDGLALIAGELGKAAVRFADFLASADGMNLINTFFANSAKLIGPMADSFGLLMQIFIRLMNAAAPVAEQFVNWIKESFEKFNEYIKMIDGDGADGGALGRFFQDAAESAAAFGELFGEVFRLIGQIIGANLGEGSPGVEFVKWMTDGLRAANDLRDGVGASGLKDYFAAVNENVKPMLGFLGDMGKILIDMGANPAVGQVFEILRQAEPSIRKIAMALLDAGPSLAQLVVKILEVLAAFTDTGQITAFFDTLTGAVSVVANLVQQAWFMKLMEQISPLLGTLLALQSVFNGLKFAFNVLFGAFIGLIAVVGTAYGVFQLFSKVLIGPLFSAVGRAGMVLLGLTIQMFTVGPAAALASAGTILLGASIRLLGLALKAAGIGAIITLVAALVVGFMELMSSNKEFKKIFTDVFDKVKSVFAGLAPVFNQLSALFGKVVDAVMPLIMNLAKLLIPLLGKLMEFMAGSAGTILTFLMPAIEGLVNVLVFLVDLVSFVVDGLGELLGLGDGVLEWGTRVDSGASTASAGLDGLSSSGDTTTASMYGTADSMDAVGSSAEGAAPKVVTFRDHLTTLNETVVASIEGDIAFRDSQRQLTDALSQNGTELLGNSAAADANKTAIIAAAQAVKDKMKQDIESGVPIEQATARYMENYEALKQTAINAGLSADEVNAFVKQLGFVPILTVAELKLKTDTAQKNLNDFIRKVGGTVAMVGRAGVTLQATGGFNDYVKGTAFASGGIAEGVYRSMARPMYKFAEPETGWEAFVSGRKGSEDRNRGIVREAASRLGMNMGGVSITVNPSPGMDERALAGAVSQEITKLMRKGSIY